MFSPEFTDSLEFSLHRSAYTVQFLGDFFGSISLKRQESDLFERLVTESVEKNLAILGNGHRQFRRRFATEDTVDALVSYVGTRTLGKNRLPSHFSAAALLSEVSSAGRRCLSSRDCDE